MSEETLDYTNAKRTAKQTDLAKQCKVYGVKTEVQRRVRTSDANKTKFLRPRPRPLLTRTRPPEVNKGTSHI